MRRFAVVVAVVEREMMLMYCCCCWILLGVFLDGVLVNEFLFVGFFWDWFVIYLCFRC